MYYIAKPDSGNWISIPYQDEEINICRIEIIGDEFDTCIRVSKKLDSKTWNESHYREGLLNKKTSLFDTEETGVISEWAICKLFGLLYNGKKIQGGYPYDFLINNKKYDVKGSVGNKGKNYIKAIHENNGKKCTIHSDFFFLSYINVPLSNKDEKKVIVDIVGMIKKENVEKIIPVPSPIAKSAHYNYEINFNNPDIITIKKALEFFNNKKQKKECIQRIEEVNIVL